MTDKTAGQTSDAPRAAAASGARTLPPRPAAAPKGLLARGSRVVGSYGVAVVLLLLLFVLTLLGTLEQQYSSLYDVQRKYFESLFLVHWIGRLPIPLPGATLVIALLGINLIVGGVVRIRKRGSTAGILVAHLGILILLGGGLVETLASDKGQMTLVEGDSSDVFRSYFEWEVAVAERKPSGGATEYVIGNDRLDGLSSDEVAVFTSDHLPFDVRIEGWERNSLPEPAARTSNSRPSVREDVEGWVLGKRKPEMKAEGNVAGAYVTLVPKSREGDRRGLLWGAENSPWVTTVAGRRFEVGLRKRTWPLPFRITLEKAVQKEHPGTHMPSEYSSYVVKTEDGVPTQRHITMNEPLRHRGYTFYQSGFQAGSAGSGNYSTFSVVRNPSDRVPIVACSIIFLGLVIHFGTKLYHHIRAQSASLARAPRDPKAVPA